MKTLITDQQNQNFCLNGLIQQNMEIAQANSCEAFNCTIAENEEFEVVVTVKPKNKVFDTVDTQMHLN